MKKLLLMWILGLSVWGFTGCMNNDAPVYYFSSEPAIVDFQNQNPVLRTAWGIFGASGLSDTLKSGDCLWTNFIVDMNGQRLKLSQVSGLQYRKLGKDAVREVSGDMNDEYCDCIEVAALYKSYVDRVLFFDFYQRNPVMFEDVAASENSDVMPYGNGYAYEIMYNMDSTVLVNGREIPKLYIKSKKMQTSGFVPSRCRFAFNMAEFVAKYAESSSQIVPLYIHYKTGVSPEGKDVYKAFKKYPVEWKL